MKKTAILMLVVAMSVANAAPAEDAKPQPEVVKSVYHNNGDKGYDFEWVKKILIKKNLKLK